MQTERNDAMLSKKEMGLGWVLLCPNEYEIINSKKYLYIKKTLSV